MKSTVTLLRIPALQKQMARQINSSYSCNVNIWILNADWMQFDLRAKQKFLKLSAIPPWAKTKMMLRTKLLSRGIISFIFFIRIKCDLMSTSPRFRIHLTMWIDKVCTSLHFKTAFALKTPPHSALSSSTPTLALVLCDKKVHKWHNKRLSLTSTQQEVEVYW